MSHPRSPISRRAERVAGVAIVAASCVMLATLLKGSADTSAYLSGAWFEVGALAVAGTVVMAVERRPPLAAAVALPLAAQLAGGCVNAFKRWEPIRGFGSNVDVSTMRVYAVAAAVGMLVAVAGAVVVLVAEGGIRAPRSTGDRLFVGVGILLAVTLPVVLGAGDPATTDVTSIGAYSASFALPWGFAFVATAMLPAAPRLAVALTIATSALALLVPNDRGALEVTNQAAGWLFVVAVALVAAALATRLNGGRARTT
jgi:hypothetical protein